MTAQEPSPLWVQGEPQVSEHELSVPVWGQVVSLGSPLMWGAYSQTRVWHVAPEAGTAPTQGLGSHGVVSGRPGAREASSGVLPMERKRHIQSPLECPLS